MGANHFTSIITPSFKDEAARQTTERDHSLAEVSARIGMFSIY
jgi:hypothetical protein